MKHLEFEKLVENFEGSRSSQAERLEVVKHLQICADCSARAAQLELFFAYAEAARESRQVSQADTARLLNIFQPRRKTPAKKESLGRRILASLVFDDWQTAIQERFAFSDSRQMLYRAGEFEIDLRLAFADGKCILSGQILPDCKAGAMVEIFSDETSEKVFVNDYCEFVFPPVAEGTYTFRMSSGEELIEIEKLSLLN